MAQHVSIALHSVSRVGWPQANSLLEMSLDSANSQILPRSPLEEGGLFRAKTMPGTLWCCSSAGNSLSSQEHVLAWFHLLVWTYSYQGDGTK